MCDGGLQPSAAPPIPGKELPYGNAVMLKAGDAEIAVTENEPSPIMARVRITVVAA